VKKSVVTKAHVPGQTGAALIMALLLVAIVAAISTSIMFSQQVDIQRTILQNTANQAELNNRFVQYWWEQLLPQLENNRTKQQQLPLWPQQLPATTLVNGDVISADVTPANARFNLNNLAQPVSQYLTIFANLIRAVDSNISAADAMQIALNTQQWLVAASTQAVNPYAKMSPPYQAAHRQMASASELRLVQGITGQLFSRLRPYIIALPETNVPIDVNAAAKPVLMALFASNESAAEDVLQYRRANTGFLQDSAFLGLQSVQPYAQETSVSGIDISSLITTKMPTYFLVHTVVKHDKMNFERYSILFNSTKNKTMTVLQQGQSL
jgi:general secretion pathway protein K